MTVTITDIEGVSVGHASDFEGLTGVTVILVPSGMTGGVTISGFASSTRQIDALSPAHIVPEVHAICIAGGSAYGLDAASGVMSYLEEKGSGFDVGVARIPIVPTAVIFDLRVGSGQWESGQARYCGQGCQDTPDRLPVRSLGPDCTHQGDA